MAQLGYRSPAQAMVLATALAGFGVGIWSAIGVAQSGAWVSLLILVMLSVLAELFPVHVYEARGQTLAFSLSSAVMLAAVSVEPTAAPLVGMAAGLAHALTKRRRGLAKLVFGISNPMLAGGVAGGIYALLRPAQPGFDPGHLMAALAAVLAYVATNTGSVGLMIALQLRRPWAEVWRDVFWLAPTNVLLGLTGAFVGVAHDQLGPFGVAMLAMPVLLTRWTLGFHARRSRATMLVLEHRAHHDGLTDLANRYLLEERIQAALNTPTQQPVAVVLLDLDRFQEINDTFGHQAGDLVLRQIGPRLRSVVRQSDTLARLGGDEFAIVLPTTDHTAAVEVAEAVRRVLAEPFAIEGYHLEIGASMGVAIGPGHGQDAPTLLQHADVALAIAKRTRAGWVAYDPEQDDHTPERIALMTDLRQAIEQGTLSLHYQPQVSRRTGRVISVEALLRWNHPRLGPIAPDDFVPLAEHTGLIRPLTRWVLGAALEQCRAWLDQGRDISVAVNVSAHDVRDASFPGLVEGLLELTGVPASRLCLELTEGTMMTDLDKTLSVLTRLSAAGIAMAVDDFGTGYASLAYLKRLPIGELKIDRAFVRSLSTDEADAAIVESTIALGHKLRLNVVAEGVEDDATWDLLGQYGCDVIQGYLVSKPVSADELERWLDDTAAGTRAAQHAA